MKQSVIILLLAFSLCPDRSCAQLPDGSVAPDWTFNDINGNPRHLYEYLDSGYTVYFNICATWCPPCWTYHQSDAMQDLFTAHGPAGYTGVSASTTDDVMVFFLEGESSNTTAALYGTGSSSVTCGNFVAGTSYPIIDIPPSSVPAFNALYNVAYYPTIYMVCPDRILKEVGQLNDSLLYLEKAICPTIAGPNDAELVTLPGLNPSLFSCDSVTPSFRLVNLGSDALTSAMIIYDVDGIAQQTINWTGNLATYAYDLITGVSVFASSAGTHTIGATVWNPNGSADASPVNNSAQIGYLKLSPVGIPGLTETFQGSSVIPSSWYIEDGGNSGVTWTSGAVGFGSSRSMKLPFYDIPAGEIDWITVGQTLSFAGMAAPTMSFDLSYRQYSTENDKLEVQVSTDCGVSWTSEYLKSGSVLATLPASTLAFTPTQPTDWRNETVNLSAYANAPSVLVRFKGTSQYGNNLYIDNVNIGSVTSVNEGELSSAVSVFPNPMNDHGTIQIRLAEAMPVSLSLVNALGQEILSADHGVKSAGSQEINIDNSGIGNGIYFLNIRMGDELVTRKIVVNR